MGQLHEHIMRGLAISLALAAAINAAPIVEETCPTVTAQPNFNLTNFVDGGKWYIHQQMAIKYLPANEVYCVTAQYEFESASEVKVHNYANIDEVNGKVDDSDVNLKLLGGICGQQKDANEPAKLSVGPCRLPGWFPGARGPYWVLAAGPSPDNYEWALISGGQPTIQTPNGCQTGTGVNGSGLWIFLRSQTRDQKTIDMIRELAVKLGFDLSVLHDVQHEGCKYTPAQ